MSVEISQLVKCLLYKCKDPGNPMNMWKIQVWLSVLIVLALGRQKQVDTVSW